MSILLYALFALVTLLSAVVIFFFVDDLRQGHEFNGSDTGAPEGDSTSPFNEEAA